MQLARLRSLGEATVQIVTKSAHSWQQLESSDGKATSGLPQKSCAVTFCGRQIDIESAGAAANDG